MMPGYDSKTPKNLRESESMIRLPLRLVGVSLLCSFTILSGCKSGEKKSESNTEAPKKLLIVCTTTMIADQAREVAGDHAKVASIMRPGINPHTYEPRPDDSILFRKADLILANGLHLEGRMLDMIEAAGNKAHKLGEHPDIKTRTSVGGALPDPHVWWNIRYFVHFVEQTADALAKLDPANAKEYRENAKRYISQLEETDKKILDAIKLIPEKQRLMITSHDAFYYYGRRYGLKVDAVLGISTDAEANAGEPLRLAKLATENNIGAVFHETSVSQAQNDLVDSITRLSKSKFDHELKVAGPLYSDSLDEPGAPAGTYSGAIWKNTSVIVEALTGKKLEELKPDLPASPTQ